MNQVQRSVNALLEIYKQCLLKIAEDIQSLSEEEIAKIRDYNTNDEDCKSIKTILEHVIYSGYIYTYYFKCTAESTNLKPVRRCYGKTATDFIHELNLMYNDCEAFFLSYPQINLFETDMDKKIKTNWGQIYDIDQLFEHGIVHLLRHERQIRNFINEH